MNKYEIGTWTGRTQPLQKGHIESIGQGLDIAKKMYLVIGSANRHDELNNPLTYEEREAVLREAIKREGWQDRIIAILPLDDIPSDPQWVENLKQLVPGNQVLITNNDWVINITKDVFPAYEPELVNRQEYEGTTVRNLMATSNPEVPVKEQPWASLVPSYTLPFWENYNLIERLKRLNSTEEQKLTPVYTSSNNARR